MQTKWWTLVTVALGVFMLLLDITIVNVALPDIQRQLHASLPDLQWVIDAYALSLAALLLTAGSVADLLGRRIVFAAGIAVFTAGSLLCGVAQSPVFLSLARAGQGVGGAVMFATSLALLADAFRGEDRGVAFGVFGAITGIAIAVGPVLGGAITSGLTWRWIFFVNVPIGVIAIALTLLRVEESRDPDAGRPDWLGALSFSGALAALVYGLIESNTHSWGSGRVTGALITAAGLLAVFVLVELRQRRPMFDLALLRNPTFVGGLASAFAISASAFSVLTFIVLYLQNVLGDSAIGTGLRLLALSGALFLTAGIAGRLTSKVPTRLLIGPGFVLIGIGLLLMRGITSGSGWTHLLPGLIVAGIGAGLVKCRSPQPPSGSSIRTAPAWRPASTRRSARSASPPVSRHSDRSSPPACAAPSPPTSPEPRSRTARSRSRTRSAPGRPATSWPPRHRRFGASLRRRRSARSSPASTAFF